MFTFLITYIDLCLLIVVQPVEPSSIARIWYVSPLFQTGTAKLADKFFRLFAIGLQFNTNAMTSLDQGRAYTRFNT